MLKTVLAGTTALVIAGVSLAAAQSGPRPDAPRGQPSVEDVRAMTDARVAALKAALRLTPEQEKSWPAVEAAIRDLAKERVDRISERRAARDRTTNAPRPDVVERMRRGADAMSTRAASLKKLADAADPLYKSLDDSQKRRFSVLLHNTGRLGLSSWASAGRRFGDGPRFRDAQRFDHRGRHGHHGHRDGETR
jgi:hypothetical protein